jgi:hypothetical protein
VHNLKRTQKVGRHGRKIRGKRRKRRREINSLGNGIKNRETWRRSPLHQP